MNHDIWTTRIHQSFVWESGKNCIEHNSILREFIRL